MTRLVLTLGLVLFGAATGCSHVGSAAPGVQNATGEAWYAKHTLLLFIPLKSEIYYCDGKTPVCRKAAMP